MGRNSPRYSAGASGLRSQVSWWAGPPFMKSKMQALARPKLPPGAEEPSAALPEHRPSKSGLMPASASPPAQRASRRDIDADKRKLEQPEVMAHPMIESGVPARPPSHWHIELLAL